MTTGLPGHHVVGGVPTPLSPHPDTIATSTAPVVYQSPSVAGPRQKRQRKKGTSKDHQSTTVPHSGSEGDSSSEGGVAASGGVRGGAKTTRDRKGGVAGRKGRRVRSGRVDQSSSISLSSASESEPSDSDLSSTNLKDVGRRIRLHCLMCLSTVFQSLDRHCAFSYGLPFLPDSPRSPLSPPTLLTCLCKDPIYKCRSAAAAVLNSILEGSRPFITVADDSRSSLSLPYTPYSTTLGNVIQELHRTLLVSVTTEHHSLTLTHVLKCLSVLIVNTPYRTLTKQYIRNISTAIKPLTSRTDTDVVVGCLTCYGAILSLNPPVKEVEVWLREDCVPRGFPWLIDHCLMLIKSPGTAQSLQMEAIQVLTAVIKFNFHSVKSSWVVMSEVYCNHMSRFTEPLQQHSLRYLEELGRVLYSEVKEESLVGVVSHWERLLEGPLTRWLQAGHKTPPSCAQSCSVLATIGSRVLEGLKPPTRVLALTILLGLSRDENSSIKSSAMRSLGVLCQYACLSDDPGFLMDCAERIKEGLALDQQLVVRTQAGWAIGNLTDSFHMEESRLEILPTLFPSLVECATLAMKDNEKVKVNAVRASGNLLKTLDSNVLDNCGSHMTVMCSLLTEAVNNGGMKTRWNACYACHNALKNTCFTQHFKQHVLEMLEALCTALTSCNNYKVRTNAALAISSSPASLLSHEDIQHIWVELFKAAESTAVLQDFAEYKQANALKQQICITVCKLISQLDESVLPKLSFSLPAVLETELAQCIHNATTLVGEQGSDSNKSKEAVECARKALEKFDEKLIQEIEGLAKLVKIFGSPKNQPITSNNDNN